MEYCPWTWSFKETVTRNLNSQVKFSLGTWEFSWETVYCVVFNLMTSFQYINTCIENFLRLWVSGNSFLQLVILSICFNLTSCKNVIYHSNIFVKSWSIVFNPIAGVLINDRPHSVIDYDESTGIGEIAVGLLCNSSLSITTCSGCLLYECLWVKVTTRQFASFLSTLVHHSSIRWDKFIVISLVDSCLPCKFSACVNLERK